MIRSKAIVEGKKFENRKRPAAHFSRSRRSRSAVSALLALVVAVSVSALWAPTPASAADDQLTQLAVRRVSVFTNWLQQYKVPGVVGEIGWPGDRSASEEGQWNALANRVYSQLDSLGIPAAYWGVGEDSMLNPYPNQVKVLQGHSSPQRGLNLGGGEYGNNYPSNTEIDKAAAAGIAWVRIPFHWETMQPSSYGALDQNEVNRYKAVVDHALADGMNVEIDNHNYSRYYGNWTNSGQLSDFWKKFGAQFSDNRVSFGIMNEPYLPPSGAENWHSISQSVVTALRNAKINNLLTISSDHWSNAHYWSCINPAPWITDPVNNYRYEAHTYFDATTSGRYSWNGDNDSYSPMPYDNTYQQAQNRGGVDPAYQCDFNADHPAAAPPQPGGAPVYTPPSSTTTTTSPPPTTSSTSTTSTTTTPTTAPSGGNGSSSSGSGYRAVAADGTVYGFGSSQQYGNAPAGSNVVAIASTASRRGYWLATADGKVFRFGDAANYGDLSGVHLQQPIIGITRTASGNGYWLLGKDGGIFTFGDAEFHGSEGSTKLNKPVVGMTPTSTGKGYWLVASDGGIFTHGDAGFVGSTGSVKLNAPVVGMAAGPNNAGYWLVGSDGGIFTFGPSDKVGFYGSTAGVSLNAPVLGMVADPSGKGYTLFAKDGGVFNYGKAPFVGSLGSQKLSSPIVGLGL